MSDPLDNRKFTPRQERVLAALLAAPAGIFREEIDRISGASNGPEVIAQLRHQWGVGIDTERVERTDRDGKPCKPGKYLLTPQGRQRASELCAGSDG